jgi:UDP-2-acetamido-3-amino-2,3-dideoxy-glucuronate N-acetyltransferase
VNNNKFYIHPTAIMDEGCQVGEGSSIWHFTHLMRCTLGKHCNIGQNVFIANDVLLGNNVKVQNNVSLYSGVSCADDVFIGPSVVFTNILNPRSHVVRKDQYLATHIGLGASLGANSTILCGITIGEYALIGAGAVVTKSVLPYSLVVGNPSKQIGWVSQYGHTLKFDKNGIATCRETQQQYCLSEGRVGLLV